MNTELIEKLKSLPFKKIDIEKEVGLPKNTLAGMITGSKKMTTKWEKALENYVAKKTIPPENEE